MKRSTFALALLVAVVAAAGMLFYERQLIELRSELEEARLREAQAAAALDRLSEIRRAEVRAARVQAEDAQRHAQEAAQQAHAAADRARADAERAAAKARVHAERARASAEAAVRNAPAAPSVWRPASSELFLQAQALEREGKEDEAVKLYIRAARGGSGPAARRLGEIYDKGTQGVSRDYAESLTWFNAARVLGEDVPMGKSQAQEAIRQALERAEKDKRAAEAARRAEEARQEAARRALEEAERKSPFIKEPYRPDPRPYSLAPLLEQAAALEAAGRGPEAVKVYERAARSGSGRAALRLGEIYDKGIPGVAPDYPTSLKWRNAASVLGEEVPLRR